MPEIAAPAAVAAVPVPLRDDPPSSAPPRSTWHLVRHLVKAPVDGALRSAWHLVRHLVRVPVRLLGRDPRHGQIATLGSLVLWSHLGLGLPFDPAVALPLVAAVLLTQIVALQLVGAPRMDLRSPLISAFSLLLLLRTTSPLWAVVAGVVAVAGKFLIRRRGKHVFNPTNLALVAVLVFTDQAWVSPGQWGSAALVAFFLVSAGSVVTRRAERSDVTWAFLGSWAAILFGRALWLGDPLAIPLHQLQDGALLVFAFLMISDPMTTPDSRAGRILFAALVAALGAGLRFGLWWQDGLLYALVASAPLVPLLDRVLPARRFAWPGRDRSQLSASTSTRSSQLHRSLKGAPAMLSTNPSIPTDSPRSPGRRRSPFPALLAAVALLAGLVLTPAPADAFCGFYVSRAEADIFNRASRVVLARDGERTVITMANDFEGTPDEFAVVIPVPTFIEEGQIHVADMALVDHLDAFTAPRLVEYYDENPCQVERRMLRESAADMAFNVPSPAPQAEAIEEEGVRIEASYTVGEYDILILSADESRGLVRWLTRNGYRLPPGAEPVVGSYLRQGMRFFVAKVNLGEHERLGATFLRPLQVAYESKKFMLPIRLGTVNADGPQELFIYTLTRTGRVETTNYRTVRLPTGQELPPFVEAEFADFYRDLFEHQTERERRRAVFLEYAWDMGWCDPCAADPLSGRQLRELGAFWLAPTGGDPRSPVGGGLRAAPGPQDVFVTRLHLSYTGDTFPADLVFQETGDRSNFQGRYVLRHPWKGSPDACPAAREYFAQLEQRQEREARTLARLTGWDLAEIRDRAGLGGPTRVERQDERPWWERLWDGLR